MHPSLIAPCGMNCHLCSAFARERNACPGCRDDSALKPKTRTDCKIKTCGKISDGEAGFCFECEDFPCPRLKQLDMRYRTKYGMSMIENLENIQAFGMKWFLKHEKERWTCPQCGNTLCVHKPECLSCGYKWR